MTPLGVGLLTVLDVLSLLRALTAWPLSGVPSMTETFRRELKTLSSVHGGTPQNPFTLHTSASGSDTVVDGAEIPFVKM